jgi:hypothetical protein
MDWRVREPFTVQVCSNCEDIDPNNNEQRARVMRIAGHKVD